MSKRPKHEGDFHDFVPLLFARNLGEAEFYKSLLEDHDIPVLIEDENTESIGLPDSNRGVPVMVPDEMLAEAEGILEQRERLEDEFEDFDEEEDDEDEDEKDLTEVVDPDIKLDVEEEVFGGIGDLGEEDEDEFDDFEEGDEEEEEYP